MTFFQKGVLKRIFDKVWGYGILRHTSTLIALTKTEAEQYKRMGVSKDKIEIDPNGINLAEFDKLPKRGNLEIFNHRHPLKRKVLIIDSDRRGLLIRPIRIARTLRQRGYEVQFLEWDRTATKPRLEYVERFKIHNFRFKPISSQIWGLIPSYAIWWIYVFFFLFRNDSNLYHPCNLYNLIPAIPPKILKRKKIVYDLLDFVADSFDWPKPVGKLLGWLERFCIRFADGVIIVDEHRRKQIDISNVKNLAVVMNCPANLVKKLKAERDQGELVIYYGGWIADTRGLKHICEVIRNLDGVKLIIAGFGPDEVKLKPVFNSQENIDFKGLLSDVESLEWTNRADIIFAFYDPKVRINRLASPNKLFDAMMCGKPVLANSEALPVTEIIERENCGVVVPYEDIEGIRNAIKWFKENPEIRSKMGQNARKAFEREYNWTEMESRLLKLYSEVFPLKTVGRP